MKKTLKNTNVENKVVLLRCDYNVPIKDGVIQDLNRINASLETINYLLDKKAKVIVFSHLGRIKTKEDCQKNSLAIVAKALSKLLNKEVVFAPKTRGKELEDKIQHLNYGEVLLVENTRHEDVDGKKESKNDPELGKYWASLGEVFVNDSFGMVHRNHASNNGIAANIKTSCVGFLVEKELVMLGKGVDNPKRPFVAIVGGAKVSDKIGVIENMLKKADRIIIGGGMAYTFLKAKGLEVGKSLLEEEQIGLAKKYLDNNAEQIFLPIDHSCSKEFANNEPEIFDHIPHDYMSLDIGPKTIEVFKEVLKDAKTVVWNGPMGVFELKNFAKGTNAICEIISNLKDCYTIIGGGDSASAAFQLGYGDKFSHISTGGGASLTYMEGKELIGLKAIQDE